MRRTAAAAALAGALLCWAGPAFAQEGVGLGLDLEHLGLVRKAKKDARRSPPMALAVESVFGPEFWTKVGVSSAGPTADLSRMVREGCYKLEILQLLMMSAESGRGLDAVLERRKKRAKLPAMAADLGLDYARLYEGALAVSEIVDREYLPRHPERRARKGRE
ncbi:MAG: hypothetical protein HY927_03160 [Elusimicrobia bacterium]|nr:hypothetical protein [Elusimicrobiota bacterium]